MIIWSLVEIAAAFAGGVLALLGIGHKVNSRKPPKQKPPKKRKGK